MSVYKLIPSHYVTLHRDVKPLPAPPCTAEQFENLKLLLHSSNSKLTNLAATIRELRGQLRERDATIAALTAAAATRSSTVVDNHIEVLQTRRAEPQDVVVDVNSDIQVRLKVELLERAGAPPVIKVASTVVTRRSAAPDPPPPPPTPATERTFTPRGSAPGPVRGGYSYMAASPLYGSLMWRTRQRARELGYRFVWSRYGKILVKKDVQSPPIYILEEADLRKMV